MSITDEEFDDFWQDLDPGHIAELEQKIDQAARRGRVLFKASRIINGERQTEYGNPEDSFAVIAKYWSVYLGKPISASDVAMMMVLFKIAREQNGAGKEDNIIDACGYLALYGDMRSEKHPS